MVPGSLGYNTPALNVLGQDVKQYPWTATTERFGVLNGMKLNAQIEPLIRSGLMLPNPSTNTTINYGGKILPLSRNPDLFRAFVQYRGEALQRMLTPDFLSRITSMDREKAQFVLDGEVNVAVRDYGQARVMADLRAGKLKADFERSPDPFSRRK